MTRTITRLFDNREQALRAVQDLEAAGVDRDRISFVANNADNWHRGEGPLADERVDDGENHAAHGAGKGAATGGVIGGVGGLLAGLGMLAIPGLGPVVAAGWLASTAAGAAIGAAAGGATGGLLGALKDSGHTDEEANVYSEGVRRGGTLVSVRAEDSDAARIDQVLQTSGGVDAATRGRVYREAGWSRFDADAPAWSADQINAERRTFARGDDVPSAATEAEIERERNTDLGRPASGYTAGRDV